MNYDPVELLTQPKKTIRKIRILLIKNYFSTLKLQNSFYFFEGEESKGKGVDNITYNHIRICEYDCM